MCMVRSDSLNGSAMRWAGVMPCREKDSVEQIKEPRDRHVNHLSNRRVCANPSHKQDIVHNCWPGRSGNELASNEQPAKLTGGMEDRAMTQREVRALPAPSLGQSSSVSSAKQGTTNKNHCHLRVTNLSHSSQINHFAFKSRSHVSSSSISLKLHLAITST